MNDHGPAIREAIRLCGENGEDLWHVAMAAAHGGGVVLLHPDCVLVTVREAPDCLFVWLALGSGYLGRMCDLAPPEIAWLHWERNLKLVNGTIPRQFPMSRIRALCHHVVQKADRSGRPGQRNRIAAECSAAGDSAD